MEGFTYLTRKPRRGDVLVFETDGIASLPPAQIHVKRVAGEPGDRVGLSNGQLFVNDKQVVLSNAVGRIAYDLPPVTRGLAPQTNLTVPEGCYFVLGDNSANSLDSRFYGSVPNQKVLGRIWLCYWPPHRIGGVK